VPITGQTFGVLLAGVMLGRRWGGVSVAAYVGIGAAGVPWFSPSAGMAAFTAGGIGHLTGATGGFLIGFVLAALFLGYFTDRFVRSRSFVSMFVLMTVANFVLIYGPGLLWLGIWLKSVGVPAAGLGALLTMGMLPFIPGDITKAAAAAAITRGVTPKTSYAREADADKWANWRLP
jgi:biotin transport system substrate-specific component